MYELMSSLLLTLSLDPEDTDSVTDSADPALVSMMVNIFSSALTNPSALDQQIRIVQGYYGQYIGEATQYVSSTVTTQTGKKGNVQQLDIEGNEILSSSQAIFSENKTQSKTLLGSVEKISPNEILIADSINKRAIIVDTYTDKIKWEYNSDRYVIDAHWIPHDEKIVIEDSMTSDMVYANGNQKIIWFNNTASPVTIYAGMTDPLLYDPFYIEDYPKEIDGQVIEPQEYFSYGFQSNGKFWWFSYPGFEYQGTVLASNSKLSPKDYFVITESDASDSEFVSRVVKVDVWGNIIWSFGEGFLSQPKDARPIDGRIIIST